MEQLLSPRSSVGGGSYPSYIGGYEYLPTSADKSLIDHENIGEYRLKVQPDEEESSNNILKTSSEATSIHPSVHPIDTFAKKLREQALELSRVYEQMEKKTVQLEEYKDIIKKQKAEILQQHRKNTLLQRKIPSTTSLTSQKLIKTSTHGMVSSVAAANKKIHDLQKKLAVAEEDKKKSEKAYARLEHVIVELKSHLESKKNNKIQEEDEDFLSSEENDIDKNRKLKISEVEKEQQLYIRVLEEAVHLKASEFQITGHEELLMVLAELRHTIFQQEKEIQQLSHELDQIKHINAKKAYDQEERIDLVSKEKNKIMGMNEELKAQNQAILHHCQQLQRRVEKAEGENKDLKQSVMELESKEQLSQQKAAALSQQNAMKDQKLLHENANLLEIESTLNNTNRLLNEEQSKTRNMREQIHSLEGQLEEMKRLQDELLGTLNEFSQREKDRKQQKDVLESTKRKLQLDKEKLEQDLKSLKSEKSELHASIQVLEDTIASKDDLAERMQNTQVETENQLHEQIQILNEDYKTALQTITDLSQYKKVLEQFDFAVSENLRQQQEETEEDSAADVQSSTCNSLLDTYIVQQSCNVFNSIMSSTPFSTEASLITANFPTLVDFCKRFVSGSAQLVEHALWMEQSWSRERNDLQNTTEEMKQTIRLLQSENDFLSTSNQEMEKESRKAKQVVEDTKNKLLLLEQKLKEVNEDFGELEASEQKTLDEKQELEQEVKELEKMMSQKNQQMAELEAQNHDLIKLEQEFAEKFSQKQLEIDTISRRLQDTESFLKRIQDEKAEWETRRELLQTEMKTASHLIEEQNRMHQKMEQKIKVLQHKRKVLEEKLKGAKAQELLITNRTRSIFNHYLRLLPVHQQQMAIYRDDSKTEAMLEILPTLLEHYTTCVIQDPYTEEEEDQEKQEFLRNASKYLRIKKVPKTNKFVWDGEGISRNTTVTSHSSGVPKPLVSYGALNSSIQNQNVSTPWRNKEDPSERNTSDLELDEQLRKIHNIFQQYDTIAK